MGQTAQNIIEVGKRLIQAKALLPHGDWQNWLESNFNLKVRMAQNFMAIAERFGKTHLNAPLNQTQMIAMLALPAEETDDFIEAKAAAGTPVEDMTVKKLREEIRQWQDRLTNVNDAPSTMNRRGRGAKNLCNLASGERAPSHAQKNGFSNKSNVRR